MSTKLKRLHATICRWFGEMFITTKNFCVVMREKDFLRLVKAVWWNSLRYEIGGYVVFHIFVAFQKLGSTGYRDLLRPLTWYAAVDMLETFKEMKKHCQCGGI